MKITRRSLVASGMASAFYPFVSRAQDARQRSVESWMNEWMSDQRPTVGVLHLSRFVEPVYFLLKPTVWLPAPGQENYKRVSVPVGFVTDFASIPSVFWSMLRPDGNYTHPAIVHDYLYWTQSTSRADADAILRIMMEDFSVGATTSSVIYAAVRSLGASAWDNNTKLKASGEQRILKRFPDQPTITWSDWKKSRDNFE